MSDARKDPVDKDRFLQMLSTITMVYIGKGKKVILLESNEKNHDEIVKGALGRTGNLRAPAIQKGNTLFVGYNDVIYEHL